MNNISQDSNNPQSYKDVFAQIDAIKDSFQQLKEEVDKIDLILTGFYDTSPKDSNYPQQVLSELLPKLLGCCKLFQEFDTCSGIFKEASPSDKQRLLAFIAASLCKTEGGTDYFIAKINEFKNSYETTHKSKRWDEQIVPFMTDEYKPWGCEIACPYSARCNHDKNMLLTAM